MIYDDNDDDDDDDENGDDNYHYHYQGWAHCLCSDPLPGSKCWGLNESSGDKKIIVIYLFKFHDIFLSILIFVFINSHHYL